MDRCDRHNTSVIHNDIDTAETIAPSATVYCATKSAVRTLTEGLRMELHSQNIRCTMISPGAVATELPESSSDEATKRNLRAFYKMAIPANSIAGAIGYVIEQPVEVELMRSLSGPLPRISELTMNLRTNGESRQT